MILLWTTYNGRDLGNFDGKFGSGEVWIAMKAAEKRSTEARAN